MTYAKAEHNVGLVLWNIKNHNGEVQKLQAIQYADSKAVKFYEKQQKDIVVKNIRSIIEIKSV